MEHGESWTSKKVGTGRRRQAGKNEVRQERGFGRWRQEEEEASRLSLVIRDVQEVYQSQHRMSTHGTVPHPASRGGKEDTSTTVRQWLRG